jgi:hypothetical protein
MSQARRYTPPAKPSKAALAAFGGGSGPPPPKVGLLRDDEREGLQAAMPQLAALARAMGVIDKPVLEWSPDEMLCFLGAAVRFAMPIRVVTNHSPDFNDDIPF